MKEFVNFIMANGYAYTFPRGNVHTGDKWPDDDAQFFHRVSYVSCKTEGGGLMVFNLEQCIGIEFYDESMLPPKPEEKPDGQPSH